nr:hypothetical protein [uncultured Rhodoferax sp.]
MVEDSIFFKTIDAAFPNIGKKIKLFWGHPEFVALMHELQHDVGDRPRAGFPAEVLMAIHELSNDHDAIYPHLARKDANLWHF